MVKNTVLVAILAAVALYPLLHVELFADALPHPGATVYVVSMNEPLTCVDVSPHSFYATFGAC